MSEATGVLQQRRHVLRDGAHRVFAAADMELERVLRIPLAPGQLRRSVGRGSLRDGERGQGDELLASHLRASGSLERLTEEPAASFQEVGGEEADLKHVLDGRIAGDVRVVEMAVSSVGLLGAQDFDVLVFDRAVPQLLLINAPVALQDGVVGLHLQAGYVLLKEIGGVHVRQRPDAGDFADEAARLQPFHELPLAHLVRQQHEAVLGGVHLATISNEVDLRDVPERTDAMADGVGASLDLVEGSQHSEHGPLRLRVRHVDPASDGLGDLRHAAARRAVPLPNGRLAEHALELVVRLRVQCQVALHEDGIAGRILRRPLPARERRLVLENLVVPRVALERLRSDERRLARRTIDRSASAAPRNQRPSIRRHAFAHLRNHLAGGDHGVHLVHVHRQQLRDVLRLRRVAGLLAVEERRERARL